MHNNSRLPAIDLARGVALLGVALVNVHAFAVGWTTNHALDLAATPWDVAAEYLVASLFTHRAYPVLAFLFGAGLAMQWARLPESTRTPRDLRPRLWALLLLGVVHGLLLWPGDVLTAYAIIGLIGVALLKRSVQRVAAVGIGMLALSALFYAAVGVGMIFSAEPPRPWPLDDDVSFAMTHWLDALAAHPREYAARGLVQLFVFDIWAYVVLGLWAGLSGALQRFVAAPLAKLSVVIIGASLCAIGTGLEYYAATRGGWDWDTYNDIGTGWMVLALLPASIGGLWLWLTVGALWGKRGGTRGRIQSLVTATGRAPLTQFFGQSLIFATIFNESLIGWHGELGRFMYSLIAIATYLLLSGFIRAWLANGHAHGPMECVWRGLTGRIAAFRADH